MHHFQDDAYSQNPAYRILSLKHPIPNHPYVPTHLSMTNPSIITIQFVGFPYQESCSKCYDNCTYFRFSIRLHQIGFEEIEYDENHEEKSVDYCGGSAAFKCVKM